MNSVILIGRLTRDPELTYTPNNQTAVTHFSIAVDRPGTQGRDRQADFIRITVFGKPAENCDRYLSKGRQVAVNGRIQTGSYKNREGQTVYTTDVIANNVEFLGGGNGGNDSGYSRRSESEPSAFNDNFSSPMEPSMPDSFEATEEDIPF